MPTNNVRRSGAEFGLIDDLSVSWSGVQRCKAAVLHKMPDGFSCEPRQDTYTATLAKYATIHRFRVGVYIETQRTPKPVVASVHLDRDYHHVEQHRLSRPAIFLRWQGYICCIIHGVLWVHVRSFCHFICFSTV